MEKIALNDNGTPFDAIIIKSAQPTRIVLFAVGSGGDPDRHLPLLSILADQGYAVIAPYFERLISPRPTDDALLLRARRLRLALDFVSQLKLPVVGVGHSIGATTLLALAGGSLWTQPEKCLPINTDDRLERLVLMAPPTGFFQAPRALDALHTPIMAWAGTSDTITPPEQAEFLRRNLGNRVPVELRVVDGAGHFSFMNTLPPKIGDTLQNREAFLAGLAADICKFITN